MNETLFHSATAEVSVTALEAFAYLKDGLRQSDWALGSWDRHEVSPGLFRGRSLFDGADVYVRLNPDNELLVVDYEVGSDPDKLLRVNSARVVPGPCVGRPEGTCLVTLMKWRSAAQSDEDWTRACLAFSTEIHMIKGRLEHGF